MYNAPAKGAAIPIQEAAANDEEVNKLVAAISRGSAIASDPCESLYTHWDEAEKSRLRSALRAIFR